MLHLWSSFLDLIIFFNWSFWLSSTLYFPSIFFVSDGRRIWLMSAFSRILLCDFFSRFKPGWTLVLSSWTICWIAFRTMLKKYSMIFAIDRVTLLFGNDLFLWERETMISFRLCSFFVMFLFTFIFILLIYSLLIFTDI